MHEVRAVHLSGAYTLAIYFALHERAGLLASFKDIVAGRHTSV